METIRELVKSQREFFKKGNTLPYNFRLKALKTLKRCVETNEKLIHRALKADLNKPTFESFVSETGFVVKEIKFAISHLKEWMQPKRVPTDIINFPGKSFIISQPLGVTLIISPWNYPFHLSIMPLIGAIAGGNTAILKPSELSPNTSRIIREILKRHFNSSYIAVVEGDKNTAEELLNERFDKIFYTGNARVGRVVMEKASKYLTPVTLELGGKSPVIVLNDAKLKTTVKRIVWGKFLNAGQTCVAPDYVCVESDIYTDFLDRLVKETKKLSSIIKLTRNYSKIINRKHFDRLISLINESSIIYSKGYVESKLTIYPTLVKATPTDPIMEDEIFGPVLPVLRFNSYDDIKEYILSKPKPLALYVFTENSEMKHKALNEIPSGGVTINDTIVHLSSSHLPFGGIGESGMGTYHGRFSFDEFTQKRAVMERGTRLDIPLRYPPYLGKLSIVKRFF